MEQANKTAMKLLDATIVTEALAPEMALEMAPEMAPEIDPEMAPEIAPEMAPEMAPDVAQAPDVFLHPAPAKKAGSSSEPPQKKNKIDVRSSRAYGSSTSISPTIRDSNNHSTVIPNYGSYESSVIESSNTRSENESNPHNKNFSRALVSLIAGLTLSIVYFFRKKLREVCLSIYLFFDR